MARAFRQIPLDARDWGLMGLFWKQAFFMDKMAVMGCRTTPYICQWVTNTIWHIMVNLEYFVLNYVDNFFMGIELEQKVWQPYSTLGNLLWDLGVDESHEKAVQPCGIIEFLGTGFDLNMLTLFVTEQKMEELMLELENWINKTSMTRTQLESIAGKLQAVSNCVRPARIFVTRLFHKIPRMDRGRFYKEDDIPGKT